MAVNPAMLIPIQPHSGAKRVGRISEDMRG